MASLEELLAEDGFNRGRHKTKTWPRRGSSGSSDASSPKTRFGFSGPRNFSVRTNSDVNPQRSVSLRPEKGGFTDPRPSNSGGRRYEEHSPDVREPKVFTSLKKYKECKGSSGGDQLDVNFKSSRFIGWKDGSSEETKGKWEYDKCYKNYLFEHEKLQSGESQNLQVRSKDGCPMPAALDEAVLKEITSMINGYVDRLLRDGSFRSSIHQGCVTSLNSSKVESRQTKDNDVLSSFKEAIRAVERMINEGSNKLELKKASLKLNAITGLKSKESDGGYTCGIPNLHLAGCAHLYLSILYKIQKKDKISAKHLLQVFCDSPYQARTKLLSGLWKRLFLPPLSYLKAWYDEEAKSIQGKSEMMMKLEFLDKVYNDLLDVGTSQFAAYYKGWLMDDNSALAVSSIFVPLAFFPEITKDANAVVPVESFSSNSSVLSRTMISKRLYESIFSQANRMETTNVMESGEEEEKDEVEDEIEEGQSDVWGRRYDDSRQKDGETWICSPNLGTYAAGSSREYYSAGSQYSVAPFEKNDQKNGKSCGSSSSSIIEADEMRVDSEKVQPCHTTKGYVHVGKCYQQQNGNEPERTQAAFQLQVTDDRNDANTYNPERSIDFPVYDSYPDELTKVTRTKSMIYEAETILRPSGLCSMLAIPRAVLFGCHEDTDQGSLFARVPKNFICPLTGLLLKEPVTLESGYTFELAAIKKRFDQGSKSCPVTGQSLKYSTIPETNIVLKHMINEWVAECFRSSTSSTMKQACNSKSELALSIFEQMLAGFSSKDRKENIKHLISLGGFHFLTQMFELGSLEEKSRAAELLVQCIQADGCYRNYLAMNIRKPSLLQLIHSGQVHARTNAASLLIELICLNRRMDITSFLSGLKTEASGTIMSDLLLCLKSSLPEERVLVAVLLLHLDLMEEERKREEWLKSMASILIGYKKKSFLETLSICWKLGSPDLVRVCLVTTAWLSHALPSLSVPALQFPSLSLLLRLKESLRSDLDIKQRVLACLCLLNFSKISECRTSLKAFAEEIHDLLKSLAEITWTAKHLYDDLFETS